MSNYRDIFVSLAWRIIPAGVIGACGWFILTGASGGLSALPQLLLGMACIVAAAIIIAPSIAGLFAEPSGSLYYPEGTSERPQPMYSIGESKRKKGLSREAFDHFAKIAEKYPHELRPYVEMMDIAIVDLQDGALAEHVFHQGMSALVTEKDRQGLGTMYRAISSRLVDGRPHTNRW